MLTKNQSQKQPSLRTKRILIYSHDTFGLGNIRRMVSIAESLVAADSSVTVLIATGSPMLQAFRLSERIDYVKLPCLRRDTNGVYSVKSLDSSWDQIMAMRSRLLLDVVDHFNPLTIIVDKKPFGVGNELRAALEHAHTLQSRPTVYLLLRDILDSPEKTIPVWARNHYHAAIDHYYDKVLVVGQRNLFDVGRAYCFPQATCKKMVYCGFLDKKSLPPVSNPGQKGKPMVLVTVGGGEDGQAVVTAVLAALKTLPLPRAFHTHIVLGPEMSLEDRVAFHSQHDACLEISDFVTNLPALMQSAALVVSMAGYNTVCELLSLRKNAILLPREIPVSEQLIRAEGLAARGIFDYLPSRNLNGSALLEKILSGLERQRGMSGSWGDYPFREQRFRQIDLNGFNRLNQVLLNNTDSTQNPYADTGCRSCLPVESLP